MTLSRTLHLSVPDQMLFYAQGMADTLGKDIFVWMGKDSFLQAGDELPSPEEIDHLIAKLCPNKDIVR